MKTLQFIFKIILGLLIGANCFAHAFSSELITQNSQPSFPASAKWLTTSELQLTLPENLDINEKDKFAIVTLDDSSASKNQKGSVSAIDLFLTKSIKNNLTLNLKIPLAVDELKSWIKKPLSLIVYRSSKVKDMNGVDANIKPTHSFLKLANLEIRFTTGLQLYPLLDSQFAALNAKLGLHFNNGLPEFKIWSPLAQEIKVLIYKNPKDQIPWTEVVMTEKENIWIGQPPQSALSWHQMYYLYQIKIYSPHTGKTELFLVTDPYSVALSANSEKSQIVDINDLKYQPAGWAIDQPPFLESFNHISIYESHLRDLTASDLSLPEELKGKYLGLADQKSYGLRHLEGLAQSGLTHLHLLPLMDFATVPERSLDQSSLPKFELDTKDSQIPQNELSKIRTTDSYNWGYDPVHFMVPEGSYATDPNGAIRSLELRKMIQSLHKAGLRVILDVVFNHTYAAGVEPFSVFDKIVPLYYHRYDDRGRLMNSSCCADLAIEKSMVEKLMTDSIVFLAKTYKVDGFRFDLMNLHTITAMHRLKDAVKKLNILSDGVNGEQIYLYGEAWGFGSLENQLPGQAFTQLRSYGQGLGIFNDRMRDALRGGTTDSSEKSDQGFATGLFYDFNHEPANRNTPIDLEAQKEKLLHLGDVIKIGLSGNLRDFRIRDHRNNSVRSADLYFRGHPTGYAQEPTETVNYVSAHDGYSLWDAVQAKMPLGPGGMSPLFSDIEDRVRSHRLMLAVVALSQGLPFFEGGSDLLRSKSGDSDSYDSGDWFNALNWSMTTNNWGVGLAPGWRNQSDWAFWSPRLTKSDLQVNAQNVKQTQEYFKALLRVRKSSGLFHLKNLSDIQESIRFPTDSKLMNDIPGFVALHLTDPWNRFDPARKQMWIFINASNRHVDFYQTDQIGKSLSVHPELNQKVDGYLSEAFFNSRTGLFQIPRRSTVIFQELE